MWGEKRFLYANRARVYAAARRMKATSADITSEDTKVPTTFPDKDLAGDFARWCEDAPVVYQYLRTGNIVVVDVSLKEIKMTKEEFEAVTGHPPEHDDLARVNCDQTGKTGHQQCGVCDHGEPAFLHCPICYAVRHELDAWKIRVQDADLQDKRFFYINLRFGIHAHPVEMKEVLERMFADEVVAPAILKVMEALTSVDVGESTPYLGGYVVRVKDIKTHKPICGHIGPSHNCVLPKGHQGGHRPGASWGTQEWLEEGAKRK